jgi:hypothetical protein
LSGFDAWIERTSMCDSPKEFDWSVIQMLWPIANARIHFLSGIDCDSENVWELKWTVNDSSHKNWWWTKLDNENLAQERFVSHKDFKFHARESYRMFHLCDGSQTTDQVVISQKWVSKVKRAIHWMLIGCGTWGEWQEKQTRFCSTIMSAIINLSCESRQTSQVFLMWQCKTEHQPTMSMA